MSRDVTIMIRMIIPKIGCKIQEILVFPIARIIDLVSALNTEIIMQIKNTCFIIL